jgi:L-seryl-tRNA(Ser) seleniumtransferase
VTDQRRGLPSVDAVLRAAVPAGEGERSRLRGVVREILAEARRGGRGVTDPATVATEARARLARSDRPTLRRVLNASGVVLHTNLGRAPLSARAFEAMREVAASSTLEYDIEAGRRGERHGHAAGLLAELAGAEDAVAVNNGAAAVLLALAALAARREVIVSRGELIEIGGAFRIPDILVRSGAKLVEVGTTNRTYVRDYAAAITHRTAAILRVHASNFRVVGFTARPESASLARLAHDRGVAFVHDLGSGTLLDTTRYGLGREETVQEAIAAGPDVVTFSGDKLLGGPQAGLAAGRAAAIARLRGHPLMRAVRPDKLTIAALIATLAAYREGVAEAEIPVWRMISASPGALERRARRLATRLGGGLVATRSTVGGGSLPGETQPSFAVSLEGRPSRVAAALRAVAPAVIGRVVDERLVLDLRAIGPEDDELLAETVEKALRPSQEPRAKEM